MERENRHNQSAFGVNPNPYGTFRVLGRHQNSTEKTFPMSRSARELTGNFQPMFSTLLQWVYMVNWACCAAFHRRTKTGHSALTDVDMADFQRVRFHNCQVANNNAYFWRALLYKPLNLFCWMNRSWDRHQNRSCDCRYSASSETNGKSIVAVHHDLSTVKDHLTM